MSVSISEDTYEKLEKLKYKYRCSTIDEVIRKLACQALTSETPAKGISEATPTTVDTTLLPAPEVKARHIPSVTKKIVTKKSKKQCAYVNPDTGEECKQKEKLEFDHIHPYSKGGPHLPDNLRLMCSHHNKHMWQTVQKNL